MEACSPHSFRRFLYSFEQLYALTKQLTHYRGKRTIWGGRAMVRKALYMPVLAAIRCNAVIRRVYQRLIARGKIHKVALVACMHKMLAILNSMAKNNNPWRCAETMT